MSPDDAFANLHYALENTAPDCDGDDRYTTEHQHLTTLDRADMRAICHACPLHDLCRAYAEANRPAAGTWAGVIWNLGRPFKTTQPRPAERTS